MSHIKWCYYYLLFPIHGRRQFDPFVEESPFAGKDPEYRVPCDNCREEHNLARFVSPDLFGQQRPLGGNLDRPMVDSMFKIHDAGIHPFPYGVPLEKIAQSGGFVMLTSDYSGAPY